MNHFITRIASLVLAFGFFISCSTLKSPKPETSDNLSEQQIQQQIDTLDKQLSSDDSNAELLYQKGSLLTKLAQKQEDPTDRTTPYTEAHRALTKAAQYYGGSSADTEKIKELLKVTWSIEHNQGVKILQTDTTSDPDYDRSAAHFNNATIVIPDSAISYKMKAKALYKNQQPQKAISVLEKARQNVVDIPAQLLEQLAYLYLENEQPQKAVQVYEQAESFSGQNLNLLHGLSNAYINAGDHRKAAKLLQQLIESKPNNIIYLQTLATELYFIAAQELNTVITGLKKGAEIDTTAYNSVVSLLKQAEKLFNKVSEENPADQELKLSYANFYHNAAAKYQQIVPLVSPNRREQLHTKISQYLSSSIPLLEDLTNADTNTDKKRIWNNLYQAYSYLGMEAEANNAKSNL